MQCKFEAQKVDIKHGFGKCRILEAEAEVHIVSVVFSVPIYLLKNLIIWPLKLIVDLLQI